MIPECVVSVAVILECVVFVAVIPEREKAEKRRHSDVSSESLSDTDVLELMQDMEGYMSEEDPDFTVSCL